MHYKLPNSDVTDLLHLGDDGSPLHCQSTKQPKQQVQNDIANYFWQDSNLPACRVLKKATIKIVCITAIFLLTVSPFGFVFASAAFEMPKSTMWLDWTFFLPLLNGPIQPIVYILSFERLREVLVKVIRCERPLKGGRTAMVLAIFRTTRSLSGNFVDNKKGVSTQNPRIAAKQSIVSQLTIISDDATFEAVDTL